jgi:DNA replication and repair protein RecF
VRSFRNLADADLDLPASGCVIVGPNGHGKTSLMEAMLYPEVFRSFRGATDPQLVRFGADGFRVEATVGGARRVAAGYDARTKQKKITLDGGVPARTADAIGVVQGVMLSPTDVALVSGGPRERRRFLDVLLAITVPGYVDALAKYRRALAQRARARPAEMGGFEAVLADTGARIVTARCRWAERWRDEWAAHCVAIGETGAPRLEYAPRTAGDAAALAAAFEASRERDRAMGRCGTGPHRDELRLSLGGRPLRAYGSAGQQRTAAMALRLVEAQTLEEAGGPALLCLDDAFAELDPARSRSLGELIERRVAAGSQVVAAMPKTSDIPDVIASLPRWSIENGKIL